MMITQQTISNFVRNLADEMISYARVKYDCANFNPSVSVIFAANRKISRGGIRNGKAFFYVIGKRFLAAAQDTGMMDWMEYKSFNRDPVIGGMYNVTWKKALASLVAHELAHAIQYYQGTKMGAKRVLGIEDFNDNSEILQGHDWFWKRIYGDLRVQFVNDNLFALEAPVTLKSYSLIPEPATPASEVVKQEVTTPEAPRAGTLYVKYAYKGNSTITRYYIDQKLAAVVVEVNRQFYKADGFGDVQEKLPFTTLAECRRFLIGM